MSKVIVAKCSASLPPMSIPVAAIPIGTYFTGRISVDSGLFVRTYSTVVLLSPSQQQPSAAASWSASSGVQVENYRVVDVKITWEVSRG